MFILVSILSFGTAVKKTARTDLKSTEVFIAGMSTDKVMDAARLRVSKPGILTRTLEHLVNRHSAARRPSDGAIATRSNVGPGRKLLQLAAHALMEASYKGLHIETSYLSSSPNRRKNTPVKRVARPEQCSDSVRGLENTET